MHGKLCYDSVSAEDCLDIIGCVTAAASLVLVVIELHKISSTYREQELRQWQAVAIYSVMEQAGKNGLSFAEIKSKYLEAAQQLSEFDIPKTAISDQALKWALLDLVSRRALSLLPGEQYRVAYEPVFMSDPNFNNSYATVQVANRITFHVSAESGRITSAQLLEKLSAEFPQLPREVIKLTITEGILMGYVIENKETKTLTLR